MGLLVTLLHAGCHSDHPEITRYQWNEPSAGAWLTAGDTVALVFEVISQGEIPFSVVLMNNQNTPVGPTVERTGSGTISMEYAIPVQIPGSETSFYFRVSDGVTSGFREVQIGRLSRAFEAWGVLTQSSGGSIEMWKINPTDPVQSLGNFSKELVDAAVIEDQFVCVFADGSTESIHLPTGQTSWSIPATPSSLGETFTAVGVNNNTLLLAHADGRLMEYAPTGSLIQEVQAFENRAARLLVGTGDAIFSASVPLNGQSGVPGLEQFAPHQLAYLGGIFLNRPIEIMVPMNAQRIYLFWNDDAGRGQFASYKPNEQGVESFFTLPAERVFHALSLDANTVWISLESGIYQHRYQPANFGLMVPSSGTPWNCLARDAVQGTLAAAAASQFACFEPGGQQVFQHFFQDSVIRILPIYNYE